LEPSDSSLAPVFLFGLLAAFFLQKAVRPGAKQSWSWGRGGGPVAVSRWGYACWAATFCSIAFLFAHGSSPPMAAVAVLAACFLATLGAGCVDTYRYKKAQLPAEPPRSERA
jgi:hypothetical protein